jgi:hypothetical protein
MKIVVMNICFFFKFTFPRQDDFRNLCMGDETINTLQKIEEIVYTQKIFQYTLTRSQLAGYTPFYICKKRFLIDCYLERIAGIKKYVKVAFGANNLFSNIF